MSSCAPSACALAAAFCCASCARSALRFGLIGHFRVGVGGSERLLGMGELGIGAGFERRQIAHRRKRRGSRTLGWRDSGLRRGCRLGGVVRVAGSGCGERRRRIDRILLRHEQGRIGKRHRLGVRRRNNHPHPHRRLVEHLFGEIERHANAAMRGGVAGQRTAVQRDAVPGDAQHVRHRSVVIEARVVLLVLLEDGEHAGRGLASGGAGRDWRPQDPAVGVVEGHLLALDRHDGHDRICRRARGRHLGRVCGGRLPGGGRRRGQCGQRGHSRKRHNGGRCA